MIYVKLEPTIVTHRDKFYKGCYANDEVCIFVHGFESLTKVINVGYMVQ
jgi:hypothetical protein